MPECRIYLSICLCLSHRTCSELDPRITGWLQALGLSQFMPIFSGIPYDVLQQMNEMQLLGTSLTHTHSLLRYWARVRAYALIPDQNSVYRILQRRRSSPN
jgi:hypothetical protein